MCNTHRQVQAAKARTDHRLQPFVSSSLATIIHAVLTISIILPGLAGNKTFLALFICILTFLLYLCRVKPIKDRNDMATATSISKPSQMIITLEDNALVADIKKALKLIRGVASVRVATISDDNTITPAMRRSINKARREYANGETISCSTPEEMQHYFDSL